MQRFVVAPFIFLVKATIFFHILSLPIFLCWCILFLNNTYKEKTVTPAINLAKKLKIEHQIYEYQHDPKAESFGLEASEKLGVSPDRVFKTLVANTGEQLVVAVLPVNQKLDLKRVAKAVKAKKAVMAEPNLVERTTGYVLGGVSPLGQKKRLTTLIHQSACEFDSIYVSAGRRGLEIELSAQDLKQALKATLCEIIVG